MSTSVPGGAGSTRQMAERFLVRLSGAWNPASKSERQALGHRAVTPRTLGFQLERITCERVTLTTASGRDIQASILIRVHSAIGGTLHDGRGPVIVSN